MTLRKCLKNFGLMFRNGWDHIVFVSIFVMVVWFACVSYLGNFVPTSPELTPWLVFEILWGLDIFRCGSIRICFESHWCVLADEGHNACGESDSMWLYVLKTIVSALSYLISDPVFLSMLVLVTKCFCGLQF